MDTTTEIENTNTTARRPHRLARRVAALAVGLVATCAAIIPFAAAPAGATAAGAQWGDYTGFCGYNSMRAEFPYYNQHYPGWTGIAVPWLFKWDAGRQAFINYRVGQPELMTGWVNTGTQRFSNLTPGYYQMQFLVQWSYNGVLQSRTLIPAARHLTDWGNDARLPYAFNTRAYSTASYCYEGD